MEENIFGDIFGNLQQDSILIRQYDLDSFYGGASLKKVFERVITQEEASFLPEQEAYIFINYHMRPWLMRLFELTFKYLIFITFEIEFKKILDESQTMTILSSFRNQHWLQPSNLDHNYITNVVDGLLTGFSNQFVEDVENLQLRAESGNQLKSLSVCPLICLLSHSFSDSQGRIHTSHWTNRRISAFSLYSSFQ